MTDEYTTEIIKSEDTPELYLEKKSDSIITTSNVDLFAGIGGLAELLNSVMTKFHELFYEIMENSFETFKNHLARIAEHIRAFSGEIKYVKIQRVTFPGLLHALSLSKINLIWTKPVVLNFINHSVKLRKFYLFRTQNRAASEDPLFNVWIKQ